MARRPSKHLRPARPLGIGSSTAVHKRDGRYVVRTVAGAAATKAYRCPGCQQPVPPGTPHVVVWPAEPGLLESSPVNQRRHWHSGCWQRSA